MTDSWLTTTANSGARTIDSNDGKIPDEVPQWVLTQDAIFDAISTQVSLADEFQKLVKTLKNKEWEQ